MNASILLWCGDTKGIEYAVSGFITGNNGNIEDSKSSRDRKENIFFMRTEFSLEGFKIDPPDINYMFGETVAKKFGMNYTIDLPASKKRIASYVGREDHCMAEILHRAKRGDLKGNIELIISNEDSLENIAGIYNIKFVRINKDKENRSVAETKEHRILEDHEIDLIGAAKYMRIFTKDFVNKWPFKIINVHHSTLPSFKGKDALEEAYDHGVKLIGATSHYIIPKLDEGPIIDQRIARVTYSDCSVQDLKKKVENCEREAFYNAMKWHLENKIAVYPTKSGRHKTMVLADVV